MSKKVLLVVLALVLALSLCVVAGCGGDAVDDNNQPPVSNNDNQTPDAGDDNQTPDAGDDSTLLPTE